jgi:hypothetical protein
MVAKSIPKLVSIPGSKRIALKTALMLNHKKGFKDVGTA